MRPTTKNVTVHITKASQINFRSAESKRDFSAIQKENKEIQQGATPDRNKLKILILPDRFR